MKINAEIDGIMATVSFVNPDGRHVAKTISTDTLCSILQKREAGASELVVIPHGLRLHATVGGRMLIGYEMYETKMNIKFQTRDGRGERGTVEYTIIMPHNMSFIEYHVQEDSGDLVFRRWFQFALKAPFYGMDTPLFKWPFPNTYGDGSCCTGTTSFPTCKSINETASAVNLFHQGQYNHDLSSNRFTPLTVPDRTASIVESKDLAEYLHDPVNPKPFPYSVLRPQFTVAELFRNAGYSNFV